jgi:O-antigen/teichoic acid export membrane protein
LKNTSDISIQANNLDKLTHNRLLVKNVFLNAFGLFAPLLAALYSVPVIIEGIGTDRFGLLTLAWAVVGYFSLFDLGLNRAIIQMVSEKLGAGKDHEIPELIWTAFFSMFALGLAGALICLPFMPYIVQHVLNCPENLRQETLHSFYLIGASIPLVVIRSGFRGVLIAYQRFDLTNIVRIPLGLFTFLAPLPVLYYSNSLFPIVCTLMAGLIISCIAYFLMCILTVPHLWEKIIIKKHLIHPLFRFGGWMTVTNVIGPVMVYMDRFFIGAILSLTTVAFYATPHEIVTKIILIPSAITGVLFPAFSASYLNDLQKLTILFNRGVKYTFVIVFPIIVIMVTFAQEGLIFWLGDEFAKNSYRIFQWLSAGVLFNCLAMVPFSLIQGAGKPDLTAKLHLIELPFYLFFLWWLILIKGAEGAAIAWSGRVVLDTLLLFLFSRKFLTLDNRSFRIKMTALFSTSLILVIGSMITGTANRFIFLFGFLICFGLMVWFFLIEEDEKEFVQENWNKYLKR